MAERLSRGDIPENGSFYPVKLDLRLLYGCNLRCKMCAQWGETGTYFDYDTPKLKRKLDMGAVERVVGELVPKGLRYVDMEGGETFLYPEIIALFKMLKSYGLFVKPVTNGTLLKEYAREVVASGIDSVNVSVDGDRETHNFVRQQNWAYDRAMEGIRSLGAERAIAGSQLPLIKICFTMTRHNRAIALRKLRDELSGQRLIDVLVVKSGPIWVPEERGRSYNELVKKYFDADGIKSWMGFLEDYGDFGKEAEAVARTVRELKSTDLDFFIDRVPSIPYEDIPRLYTDYEWNLGRTHCPVPYVEPIIESDGNVYPCNLFTDTPMSMGNIYEKPFLEIWFGERFQAFRRMLADQGGLLPICNRCCQLTQS